jgi:O-antigen/teichoic acid export membrane protein
VEDAAVAHALRGVRAPHGAALRALRGGALAQVITASAARYANEALLVLRGVLVARLLGPDAFGVWAALRLALVLGRFAAAASLEGWLQLIPQALARGDGELVRRYRQTGTAIALVAIALVALGCILHALSCWNDGDGHAQAWLATAGVGALEGLLAIRFMDLWSQRQVQWVSATTVGVAAFSTAAGAAGAWCFGLGGFLAALAGAQVFGLVALAIGFGAPALPRLDPVLGRDLLARSARIAAVGAIDLLFWNVDKLVLWIGADGAALGAYSAAAYFATPLLILPGAMVSVLRPRMAERLASGDAAAIARETLERPVPLVAAIAAPLLGAAYLALPTVIAALLPGYEAATAPGRILVLTSFFPIVAALPASALISLGRERALLAIRGASLLVATAACAAALAAGSGLVGVAAAIGAVGAARAVAAVAASGAAAGMPHGGWVFAARVLAPFALLLGFAAALALA